MTPSAMPDDAMMKANSPICVMLKPHFIASLRGCPASRYPIVPNIAWPMMMVSVMTIMGSAYCVSMCGSTSIPTETKNIAPKRSLTGATSFSILCASIVSASMDPTTKAPNAALNPALTATTAMKKHSASETMRSISPLR